MRRKLSNNKSESWNRTALHYASEKGHIECIKLLLNTNADVNETDFNNFTALYWAVQHNDIEISKLLIAHDVDVNKPVGGLLRGFKHIYIRSF